MMKNKADNLIVIFPILLALYEICTYLSNDAYLPALPHIANDLSTTNHLVQLTLTTWFMGSASMQLFLGPLADKVGRRPA
jgi:DHA1 family multidrug/chloramphenicol efflux transport protein-like MFS transporter